MNAFLDNKQVNGKSVRAYAKEKNLLSPDFDALMKRGEELERFQYSKVKVDRDEARKKIDQNDLLERAKFLITGYPGSEIAKMMRNDLKAFAEGIKDAPPELAEEIKHLDGNLRKAYDAQFSKDYRKPFTDAIREADILFTRKRDGGKTAMDLVDKDLLLPHLLRRGKQLCHMDYEEQDKEPLTDEQIDGLDMTELARKLEKDLRFLYAKPTIHRVQTKRSPRRRTPSRITGMSRSLTRRARSCPPRTPRRTSSRQSER